MSSKERRTASSGRRQKSLERSEDEQRVTRSQTATQRVTRSRTLSRTRSTDHSNSRLHRVAGQSSIPQSDQLGVASSCNTNQGTGIIVAAASDTSESTGSNVTRNLPGISRMDALQPPSSVNGSANLNETIIHHVLASNRDKLKIEIFNGKPGQDLDRWIKEYKMRTKNAGWDDTAVKDGIPMYLGGKYKHWYEGKVVHTSEEKKKKYDTSEKIFEMMLDAELHDKENWLKKLKDLKQDDAPLNRYLQDLEMICNEINQDMDEQQKVEYAYEGINKELGMRIFEKRPETLDEMRKYGKEVEAGYRKFMDENDRERKNENYAQ